MFDHGDAMFFGGGLMWLFWIVLIVVVVLLINNLLKMNKGSSNSMPESALDVLKKRYARGEIDEEEFIRKRRELES